MATRGQKRLHHQSRQQEGGGMGREQASGTVLAGILPLPLPSLHPKTVLSKSVLFQTNNTTSRHAKRVRDR